MSRLFLAVSTAVLVAAFTFAAAAQTPAAPDKAPAATPAPTPDKAPAATPAPPVTPADPFGAEVTMEPKTFLYMKGTATWETAFETLVESF